MAEERRGIVRRALGALLPGILARHREAQVRTRRAELADRFLEEIGREGLFSRRGGYQGATKARGYATWDPGGGSADEDVLEDLPMTRERSRDLARNDLHAAGMVETWKGNIVGRGLRPQSRIDREAVGLTIDQAGEYQRRAEKHFARWWKMADLAGELSFGETQSLLMGSFFENGDAFALPRPDPARDGFALRIQAVEADRVDTPMELSADLSVRMGVKIDADGRRLGYYVKKTHPGDIRNSGRKLNDFVLVPAVEPTTGFRNVFHLMAPRRIDQRRGVPFLAPALLAYKDLSQYFRAELMAAKIAACYSLFITTPDPLNVAAASSKRDPDGKQNETIEAGIIRYLAPGESVVSSNPGRPNVQFDQFVMRVLRGIGASVGMPYEQISMDFSQTTYTSGRMSLNEVRQIYRNWGGWLAEKFLQPIWERVLLEAFLRGELPAPGFEENFEEYTRAIWVGPGWTWVDPAKEVQATRDSINFNLSTLADECAARGLDWEDVLAQRAREQARIDELGLQPVLAPAAAPREPADEGGQDVPAKKPAA